MIEKIVWWVGAVWGRYKFIILFSRILLSFARVYLLKNDIII